MCCVVMHAKEYRWRGRASYMGDPDLRSGGCHLSKKTGTLGSRGLSLLLHWWCLLGRRGSSGCRARWGSSCGLCGGHSRPAGGGSSTLTRHFGDGVVVGRLAVLS